MVKRGDCVTAILDWLVTLGQSIIDLFGFLVKLVLDLVYMVQLMVQLVPAIPSFFTWMPGPVVATVGVIISVVVVFRIMGRSD